MVAGARVRIRPVNDVKETLGATYAGYAGSELSSGINPVIHTYKPLMEICKDEVHKNYPKSGGPLDLVRHSYSFNDASVKQGYEYYLAGKRYWTYYLGSARCTLGSLGLPPSGVSTAASYGPTAWSRFRPAKPVVGLGQFLAELRTGPAEVARQLTIFKDLARRARAQRVSRRFDQDASSLYLGWQFGWKPFLSDLRRWFTSIKQVDQQIANLRKHNGKRLRRGGQLFDTTDSSSGSSSSSLLGTRPACYEIVSKVRRTITKQKCWFKGSFRYYIPGLDDPKWGRFKAIRQLWDLDIDPELLYELIPFSWLVDWFSDLGSVVGNLQASISDNLTAQYAYIMHRKEVEQTDEIFFNSILYSTGVNTGPKKTPGLAICIQNQVSKSRVAASPFGFNVDMSSLTAWQLSILSALGLQGLRIKH